MKGISEWFWVFAGILAGLIILSIAYYQISKLSEATQEQKSLEQFSELVNLINNLCWSFEGNVREYELNLADTIEGIYASKDKYTEYEKSELIEKIVSSEISEGNFLCIKVKNRRLKCEELECNTSMPFLGSLPEKFSLSKLLSSLMGKRVSTYELTLNRSSLGIVISRK